MVKGERLTAAVGCIRTSTAAEHQRRGIMYCTRIDSRASDDGAVGDSLLTAVHLLLHEFVGDVIPAHLYEGLVQRAFDLFLRAALRVPPQP